MLTFPLVGLYPFDDHNAPPFELLVNFCRDVAAWLAEHEDNIAVIHCKAGKGRTGLMICVWLLYNKEWKTADDAMKFYGTPPPPLSIPDHDLLTDVVPLNC